MRCIFFLIIGLAAAVAASAEAQVEQGEVRKVDGYRGIWFDLGQRSEYGSKYSGGFGTYTAKHRPLAIYAPAMKKTFFVYGGTPAADSKHLLAMVSYYDHETGVVPRPTVVHDKEGVIDPHDNPSLSIDEEGHLWVFVSGRARARPGYIYRSRKPYDIEGFERVLEGEFTYPQPWWIAGQGFVHLFTRYTKGRELYWSTSRDGRDWAEPRKLAGMGGHYQVSEESKGEVITAFSWHPGGNVDARTNLYFVRTSDSGSTWKNVRGDEVETPLSDPDNNALVRDYRSEGRLVYLKDINFDRDGRPVIFYITSGNYRPGPDSGPRQWTVAHWTGTEWRFTEVAPATHNYDMGSIYLENRELWRIIAPTETGPQPWGAGGGVATWLSRDGGLNWAVDRVLTSGTEFNHGYVRRPVKAHPDFYALWSDGNPDEFTESHLFFSNRSGDQVWRLPYAMTGESAKPERVRR